MSNIKEQTDYIIKDQYDALLDAEKDPMYHLIYRFMGEVGLRVGEIVGTTIENPNKKARKKERWIRSLPGMIRSDIDKVSAKELGLPCDHTIHIHRKRHKENDLPLPNSIYKQLPLKYSPDTLLFPTSRVTVHVRLAALGKSLGIKRLHAHALRRFWGRYEYLVKRTPLQYIQAVYDHDKAAMTLHYLRLPQIEGLRGWALTINEQTGVK